VEGYRYKRTITSLADAMTLIQRVGPYRDTLLIAMLRVKSVENATKTRFSLVPNRESLSCPLASRPEHPMKVDPVCSTVSSHGSFACVMCQTIWSLPSQDNNTTYLPHQCLVGQSQPETQEEVQPEEDKLLRCGCTVLQRLSRRRLCRCNQLCLHILVVFVQRRIARNRCPLQAVFLSLLR
jgi:hypothetical protein